MTQEKGVSDAREISRRRVLQAAAGLGLGAAALGVPGFTQAAIEDDSEEILDRLQEGVENLQGILEDLGGTVEVNPDEIIRGGRVDVDLFLIPAEDVKTPEGTSKPLDQLDGVVVGILSTPIDLQTNQGVIPAGFSVMRVRRDGDDWVADFFQSGSSAPDATLTAVLPPQEDLPPAAANSPAMPVARSYNGPMAGAICVIVLGPRAAMFPLRRVETG